MSPIYTGTLKLSLCALVISLPIAGELLHRREIHTPRGETMSNGMTPFRDDRMYRKTARGPVFPLYDAGNIGMQMRKIWGVYDGGYVRSQGDRQFQADQVQKICGGRGNARVGGRSPTRGQNKSATHPETQFTLPIPTSQVVVRSPFAEPQTAPLLGSRARSGASWTA